MPDRAARSATRWPAAYGFSGAENGRVTAPGTGRTHTGRGAGAARAAVAGASPNDIDHATTAAVARSASAPRPSGEPTRGALGAVKEKGRSAMGPPRERAW